MEDLLARLVAMPTISSDIAANDAALDYIESYLVERGLHSKRYRFDGHGSLVATTRSHRKNPLVLLAAHVDVMYGSEKVFALREKNGKLFGRGTYDMKFAIAAYMQLIDNLRDHINDYDIGVMITSDEEMGGRDNINGTRRLIIEDEYQPGMAILPDGGTDYKIESIAKGHWRFDLIAKGRTAHGGRPWEGESASFKLIEALRDLKQYFKDHGPLTDTLNIGFIRGGEAYNQIPDNMSAAVEIRLMDDTRLPSHRAMVDTICSTHEVTYQTKIIHLPTVNNIAAPLAQAFMASLERVRGEKVDTCISFGSSDGYYFALKDIPCIVTRPIGGGLHSEEEWADRDSFLQLLPILEDYVEHVAKVPAVTPVDIKTPVV